MFETFAVEAKKARCVELVKRDSLKARRKLLNKIASGDVFDQDLITLMRFFHGTSKVHNGKQHKNDSLNKTHKYAQKQDR